MAGEGKAVMCEQVGPNGLQERLAGSMRVIALQTGNSPEFLWRLRGRAAANSSRAVRCIAPDCCV